MNGCKNWHDMDNTCKCGDCHSGYKPVKEHCVPICADDCLKERCVLPKTCQACIEYHGVNESKICEGCKDKNC